MIGKLFMLDYHMISNLSIKPACCRACTDHCPGEGDGLYENTDGTYTIRVYAHVLDHVTAWARYVVDSS